MTDFKPGDTVHISKTATIIRIEGGHSLGEILWLDDDDAVYPRNYAQAGWEVTINQEPCETFGPGDIVRFVRDNGNSIVDSIYVLGNEGYRVRYPGCDWFSPRAIRQNENLSEDGYRYGSDANNLSNLRSEDFTSEFFEKIV